MTVLLNVVSALALLGAVTFGQQQGNPQSPISGWSPSTQDTYFPSNQPGDSYPYSNPPGSFGNPPGSFGTNSNPPGGFGTNSNPPGTFGTNTNPPGSFGTNSNPPGSFSTNGNQPASSPSVITVPIYITPQSSNPPTGGFQNFNNQPQTSDLSSHQHLDSTARSSNSPPRHSFLHLVPARARPSTTDTTHATRNEDPLSGHRIVCIFNNKHFFRDGFTPGMIDVSLCTHVNYEFSRLDPKSYEMIVGDPDLDLERNFFQEATDLRKWNNRLKIMLSLGGWNDSTKKYSEMVADPEKRKNFVEKAVSFLKTHEFDGLDVAWEYPNCWQGAIGINKEDKPNFVLLLQELKAAFKPEGYILSISVGAIKREIEAAYDVPAISKTVDYMNVMTYDMHGPWEPKTGHHVQFGMRPGDKDPYCNVKAALNFWVEKGADKKKLNMGLAFYAKTFTLADSNEHGMGAPAVGVGDPGPISGEGGFLLYNELCQWLNAGNWTEAMDKEAGYYAYCGDQWACYDNPMMVVKKVKFVVDHSFGGVIIKDVSADDYRGICFSMPFPLTKMVFLEMKQKILLKKKKNHRRG